MIPLFFGKISKGILVLDTPDKYKQYLLGLNGKEVQISICQKRKARSNEENRYMWGVVYELLAEVTGYTREEIHDAMRMLFLRDDSRKVPTLRSTSRLSTIEMEQYLSDIRQWASKDLNCYIPLPNEVDYDTTP